MNSPTRTTRRARMLRPVVLGFVLVVLGLGLGLAGLGGCGRTPDAASRDAARETVRAFVEAGKAGDRPGLVAMMSAPDREASLDPQWTPMIAENPDLEYIVGPAIVDGEDATVRLGIIEAGQMAQLDLLLVLENGTWRIREQDSLQRLADEWREKLSHGLDDMLEQLPTSEPKPPVIPVDEGGGETPR